MRGQPPPQIFFLEPPLLFMSAFAMKYCEPADRYFVDKDALLKKHAIQNSHYRNSVLYTILDISTVEIPITVAGGKLGLSSDYGHFDWLRGQFEHREFQADERMC